MPAAADHGLPFDEAELDALFAPLAACRKLTLAVSGGADSFALLHLFHIWRARHAAAPDAVVLTVDHGLRAEAADEARKVGERCAKYGFEHRILHWAGTKPASGIQNAAREARFELMRTAMLDEGADALVLAHHRDDQAETFLDRLARGSGPYGLASMARVSTRDGVTLHRPLLDVPKVRLVASLKAAGLDWCEDPSNGDERYRRVTMRKLQPQLDAAGLDAERLAATARAMGRAADALDSWVDTIMRAHVERHEAGPMRIDVGALSGLPDEIVLRLFARLLRECSGADYVPRLTSLEAAVAVLLGAEAQGGGGQFSGPAAKRTLAHCVLQRNGDGVLIHREFGRTPPQRFDLVPGRAAIWDRRFEVSLAANAPGPVEVGALGESGLRRAGLDSIAGWPRGVFESAPAIHARGQLVALPGFNLSNCGEWPKLLKTRRIAANPEGSSAYQS